MKKLLISFIFLMLLCFPVCAEEALYGYGEKENPLYEHLEVNSAQLYNTTIGGYKYEDCTDYEGALAYLIEQSVERQPTVRLSYYTEQDVDFSNVDESLEAVEKELGQLFDDMNSYSEFDKNGAYSDYIWYQWRRAPYSFSIYSRDEGYLVCATYFITWFTTPEQVAQEDAKVTQILDELDVYDEDEYTQIKAVYDYVMDNASYVASSTYNKAAEKGEHYVYHSSYSALIMGETVCQGYATAIYRLLRELGISCRVVSGDAGGPHAWNMVRIGSYYYLIDATWDDTASRKYNYFLKADFKDHTPDTAFTEESFKRFFPMAEEDYTEPLEYIPNMPTNITLMRDGEDVIISFDLDYTSQYAHVERDKEVLYLAVNPLDDKTTHTFRDKPGKGKITYNISALRCEYNSRTEAETYHFNTSPSIVDKILSVELESIESKKLKLKLNHIETDKKGKLFVVVTRFNRPESIYLYETKTETEFTYDNFTEYCGVNLMWVDLATMKPLSEKCHFELE